MDAEPYPPAAAVAPLAAFEVAKVSCSASDGIAAAHAEIAKLRALLSLSPVVRGVR